MFNVQIKLFFPFSFYPSIYLSISIVRSRIYHCKTTKQLNAKIQTCRTIHQERIFWPQLHVPLVVVIQCGRMSPVLVTERQVAGGERASTKRSCQDLAHIGRKHPTSQVHPAQQVCCLLVKMASTNLDSLLYDN